MRSSSTEALSEIYLRRFAECLPDVARDRVRVPPAGRGGVRTAAGAPSATGKGRDPLPSAHENSACPTATAAGDRPPRRSWRSTARRARRCPPSTCGEVNGPLMRTRSANPAKSMDTPLRALGWNVKSSVSLRKSSVPTPTHRAFALAIAMSGRPGDAVGERSRTTAHASSVDGSAYERDRPRSASCPHGLRLASFELTSVAGPLPARTFRWRYSPMHAASRRASRD